MRQICAPLLLGMAALVGTAAHAADPISTTGFDIRMTYGIPGVNYLDVLSDNAGTTRLAVLNSGLTGGQLSTTSGPGGSYPDMPYADTERADFGSSEFTIDVHEGYRITSLTLSGTVTGVLDPAVVPAGGRPGWATNELGVIGSILQDHQATRLASAEVVNLDGTALIAAASSKPLEGHFELSYWFELEVAAQSGVSYSPFTRYYNSTASMGLHDVVLTVQVSPVPEPATWGMLLAGTALLGAVAQRRTRKA